MDRRTFLKLVFATTVAPASAVKALYRPRAGILKMGCDVSLGPPLFILFKGNELEYVTTLKDEIEKCFRIADNPFLNTHKGVNNVPGR